MLLNQSLPEPYAALAKGMLLGIDSGIPDELYDQFNLAGISHVLARAVQSAPSNGYARHIAIVAMLHPVLRRRAPPLPHRNDCGAHDLPIHL
jgi:hypothetical protein